jgi:hypothetical protein
VYGSGVQGGKDFPSQLGLVSSFLSDNLRFNQPAGIAGSSGRLFVVDSAASSLRALNLIEGYTNTVLGQDQEVSVSVTARISFRIHF